MALLRRIFLTEKDVSGRPVYTHGPVIRRLLLAYVVCFATTIGVAAWQWVDVQRQGHQILNNCREIEEIKEGGRMAAWRDFNNLDNTLKLLKLEKTPEVIQAAKDSRDRRLEQFARKPCPRPPE